MGCLDRVRQTKWFLGDVCDFCVPLFAVGYVFFYVASGFGGDDYADLADFCFGYLVEYVAENGFVGYWDELFGACEGERSESGAFSAA